MDFTNLVGLNYTDGSATIGDSAIGGDGLFIQGLGTQAVSDPGSKGSDTALGIWGDSNVIPTSIGVGKNAIGQVLIPQDTQGLGIFNGVANTFTKAVNIANGITGFLGTGSSKPKTTAELVAPGAAVLLSGGSSNMVQQNQLQNPGENQMQSSSGIGLLELIGAFVVAKLFRIF